MSREMINTILITVLVGVLVSVATQWILSKIELNTAEKATKDCGCEA